LPLECILIGNGYITIQTGMLLPTLGAYAWFYGNGYITIQTGMLLPTLGAYAWF